MLNNKCRTSFEKPEFLKKAQRANPRMYDIGCYNDNLALMLAPESDEVIRLEKESQRSRLIHTTVNNGNSKESFYKQTTLLEKRMDESIPLDKKCQSSIEIFKVKMYVNMIINGVELCKEKIANRTYSGYIDPFIQKTIEGKFSPVISRTNAELEQFHRCLNEEMVADLRYFNSLELEDLKAQLQDKGIVISELKKLMEKMKGKSVDTKFEKSSVIRQPNAFKITAQTLPPNKKYILKNTNGLAPGMYKVYTESNQTRISQLPQDSRKTNKRVSFSTGVIPTTSVSRPQLKSNPMGDRVMHNNNQGNKQEVEDQRRNAKLSKNKTSVTACNDSLNAKSLNVNSVCATCETCVLNDKHDMCVLNSVAKPIKKTVASESNQKPRNITRKLYERISKACSWWYPKFTPSEYKWKPKSGKENVYPNTSMPLGSVSRTANILEHLTSRCSKHMTGNLKLLINFVEKFLGTGNDLLTGFRSTDLYLITLQHTNCPNPICLMAKASSSQAWLWHRRLSHLNFDTINLLSKNDIVVDLPKLKFIKDHLCSSCELGKAKRKSFHAKLTPSSKKWLQLLHMDLCGPIRVASINGKRYVLVIVDDYSRFTWTYFLRSKDETLEVLIDFLRLVQRGLQAQKGFITKRQFLEHLNKTALSKDGTEHLDSENLDKMKKKGDECIFVGYSTQSRAYRVFNKRTRVIMESIHVNFNELPHMASDHISSDPAPEYRTVTTSNELDLLFSLMFDELLNGSSKVASKSFVVCSADASNQCQHPTTPLNNHTTPAPTCQVLTLAQTITSSENINQAKHDQLADDEFINIFCTPVQDRGETSSSHVDSSNMHTFYQRYPSEHRWTKDHPLEQVIGNPSQSVRTRCQLESDAEMYMFMLTVSRTEPKNIKEVMADSAWIESIREELHQFDRLDVWELVDRPLCKMSLI
nr:retrovirus-related Pol polyprotein from transposon TNT 1-94 [Tanacetum cinerariifolium]